MITATYPTGLFSSTFFGTARIEETKSCLVEDQKNHISLSVTFDKVKKKPSDYFSTHILVNDLPTDSVSGTYLGYIDIGGVRYWDARDFEPFDILLC